MTPPSARSKITSPAVRSGWFRPRMTVTMLTHKWTIDDFSLHPEQTGQWTTRPAFAELTRNRALNERRRGPGNHLWCEVTTLEDLPQRQLSQDRGRRSAVESKAASSSEFAVRPVVFPARLEYGMVKKTRGRVAITNLDHDISSRVAVTDFDVVSQMLQCIYTGSVDIDATPPALIGAADKCTLGGLQAICERSLAAALLFLADHHSADRLKANAMDVLLTQPTT
ncbi:hypothetical protein HPB48_000798 [Haemaphysalis longicornis]|uniref:BTB domain-containing protein n=1 Tax=Haemaphysalis longicornis TaxID=44386 RepID=A0A9J6GH68_HAELO|nr:hypothetical protein HPB48_000798 [Haemaphysalis longicornis]